MYSLSEGDTGAIPLLIADQSEREALRIHDLLLRFRAATAGESPAAYGEVSVLSDTPRGDILLDGSTVGRTSDDGPTPLQNVVAGRHELKIRDLSGRESQRDIDVPKGGRVEVELNLREPSQSGTANGLVPLGTNAQGAREYWRTKDGAPVVEVPAQEFLLGPPTGDGKPAEGPPRKVSLPTYLIDKTEVTWGQYRKFSRATGTPLPPAPLWGTPDDYAVTSVTWSESNRFCEWIGGRLPSEAEWESAARGTDGRQYVWGNEWDAERCNSLDGGPHRLRGVGTFPGCVSPYGALDMAGGVWEFVQDSYDERPDARQLRVIRGGSWLNSSSWLRTTFRQGTDPSWRNVLHGFRCVQNASP
jgi:formylglycine-generating enzyme required for sulfatase activity